MDGNRGSFRAITALLFICLSLRLNPVSGKPFKSSNRTGGYTPVKQSVRTITIGRNAVHAFNERINNNNNQNPINLTKVSAKSDVNSGSDIYSDSMNSDSRTSEWSLKFDPNYFASLNAANHRPIDAMMASPTDSQSKLSSTSSSFHSSHSSPSSSSSAENMFYYSPESYGKTNHKNHKPNSFAYLYPSSSSTTTTTTTSTSTTPPPKTSHNRFGDISGGSPQKGYSEPGPPYSQSFNSNDKHSSVDNNYEETPEEEEEPTYYDTNEEVGRKYYYPNRNRPKQYPIHDYYGTDLSSMSTTNENSKIKSVANSGVPSYGAQEETDIGHNIETYESGGNVRFPSKYYGSGSGAYYPSYYSSHSSQFPLASEHSYSGGVGESLLHRSSSWLGPGLAGVLLGLGLPLGILMASMIPTLMSVPIVGTATAGIGRRKRFISDFDFLSWNNTQMILNSGVLEILSKYGMSSLF